MTNHILRVAILALAAGGILASRSSAQDEEPSDLRADELGATSSFYPPQFPRYDLWREQPPVFMRAEYLYSGLGNRSLPALLTTSLSGTPAGQAGVLGEPGTSVLIGGSDHLNAPGVRGFLGIRPLTWWDDTNSLEIETSLLWLGEDYGTTAGPSTGDPILARPYFDTVGGSPASTLVAYPGTVAGVFDAEMSSEVKSLGILLRQNWQRWENWRIDAVAGYRYFKLREKLVVDENLAVVTADPWGRDAFVERYDSFRTNNYFHGGEIGVLARGTHANWQLEIRANVAIGGLRGNLTLDGFTYTDTPLDTGPNDREELQLPGGFLTSPLELGGHSTNTVGVMPQVDVTLYRRLTPDFDLTVGYTFIMVKDVLRVGDQVDVDFAGVPGATAQPRTLNQSDFFINALHVGVRL